ncbi:MAG: acetyl-CoA carboxylase biotin carboxylase subunit family protein [Bacteroidales bacterium]
MKQLKAIVLGGTNSHTCLIHNLKMRGYHTILVDYNENPPAKEAADEHFLESTLDFEQVTGIAQKENVDLVISTSVDQANVTACYVGEKLGLPIPYSFNTAFQISDKTSMKTLLKQGNIPTSNFIFVNGSEEFSMNHLNLPLVVKPADSNGSKGVRRVDTISELQKYSIEALSLSRSKKVIIEEFVEGVEIGVDCFIADNHAHIIAMHRKRKPQIKDGSVMFSLGSISPPEVSNNAKQKIQYIANQIAKIFQLNNTPLIIQLIINDDNVSVVEFAPRIGGGLNFKTIKLFTGFDIIDATVDSFLGIKVKPVYKVTESYYSENHIYTDTGIFGKITGYKKLLEEEVLVSFFPNKTHGMVIYSGKASKDRAASFIVKGETINEIITKVQQTLDTVNIFDVNGNEIAFRHNYQHKNLLF